MNRMVCLCKGVRENEILSALKEKKTTLEQIQMTTGAASNCGKCIPTIDSIIEESKKGSSNK